MWEVHTIGGHCYKGDYLYPSGTFEGMMTLHEVDHKGETTGRKLYFPVGVIAMIVDPDKLK